ncbi:MAG: hypothetical protein KDB03_07505 [Planctomycetales bacterium]|nr:hypothetical protein [Planctomycetales bacterium]
MAEIIDEAHSKDLVAIRGSATGRKLVQWNLLTLLLLASAVAVWVAYLQFERSSLDLSSRLPALQEMAGELVIEDESQTAVIRLPQTWFNEHRWDCYLPEGEYQLRLATREIPADNLPNSNLNFPIPAGRHLLQLETELVGEQWQIQVRLDQQTVLTVQEPKAWDLGAGSSEGPQYSISTQIPASDPVVFIRRRFMVNDKASGGSVSPPSPTNGVMLWIESTTGMNSNFSASSTQQ